MLVSPQTHRRGRYKKIVMCSYRPIFSLEERINFLKKITASYEDKVEIAQVSGLLVDYVEDNDIDFMVSGN